jgi:hypothetical protein
MNPSDGITLALLLLLAVIILWVTVVVRERKYGRKPRKHSGD